MICRFKTINIKVLVAVVLMTLMVAPAAPAGEAPMPFQSGEKLTFDVTWGGIPVGEAVLEVYPEEMINGEVAHHFVLTAKTVGFVDMFFKVRNRIDAYADSDMTRSVFFKNELTGKHRKSVTIDFDWHNAKIQRWDSTAEWEALDALSGSFDPLSVFYFTRTQELKEKTDYERPVTDGKKNVIGRLKIVRRETIEAGGKQYDTYLMEPETRHIGGVFKDSKNPKIQLWVTADKRRLPVKARSEVVVGSFVGELISAEGAM
ncbi:MAG: DUF3108 domain-containing protein [Desulfobacterales bacterium]